VIKKVVVKNFKCIKELELELAPLTILVGPNGSGKSSILEAIALMAQCAKLGTNPRGALCGELVEYEDLKSILPAGREDAELTLGLSLDIRIEEVKEAFEKDLIEFSNRAADLSSPYRESYTTYLKLLQDLSQYMSGREVVEVRYEYSYAYDTARHAHTLCIGKHCMSYGRNGLEEKWSTGSPKLQLEAGDAFLAFFRIAYCESKFTLSVMDAVRRRLAKVYYISAERGGMPWRYDASEKHGWVGKRGEHTLEVVAELMKPPNDERWAPYGILCELFGVRRAWAGWEEGSYLTSSYVDPYLGSAHKFPLLGHGAKQLLPVIAQLAYSEPGSVILVEEPEISLHPAHQRLLPVLFGLAVTESKQIIVTTHSSYFPLSLNLVLEGEGYALKGWTPTGEREYRVKLSPRDVAVYHVTRDEEGWTRVERLEVDEKGLKKGIPSFIDVEREILRSFISEE
jgi:Uncharacterized conserved protein